MGSFYTNTTLRGPEQAQVLEALNQMKRTAYVSATVDKLTVVYDEASDIQDVYALQGVTADLSRRLACAALAVLNHDDDVLAYWLYEGGKLVDSYNSTPSYFEALLDEESMQPEGGDAAVICRAFGAGERVADVQTILSTPQAGDGGYIFANDRHSNLVDALGLSDLAVGVGYTYISMGNLPFDMTKGDFTHVG
jgi:hypothetical protein